MIVLTLEFSSDGPELSHAEIDKQIVEFESEFAEHQQHQKIR